MMPRQEQRLWYQITFCHESRYLTLKISIVTDYFHLSLCDVTFSELRTSSYFGIMWEGINLFCLTNSFLTCELAMKLSTDPLYWSRVICLSASIQDKLRVKKRWHDNFCQNHFLSTTGLAVIREWKMHRILYLFCVRFHLSGHPQSSETQTLRQV